ncbi:cell division protein FtsX [Fusibacter bizertensis]
MKAFFKNTGYYIREVFIILKLNKNSSILSVISLALIFFIALLTVTGWIFSMRFSDALKQEAEVSVYYEETLNPYSLETLISQIKEINGVEKVNRISAEEAADQMAIALGEEAKILNQFEDNPFVPYLALEIDLNQLETIVEKVDGLNHITYIRDNQDVLAKISNFSKVIGVIGLMMTLAVMFGTFIITSHIIREGVHAHANQINTLQLLGAPNRFINTPFYIEGIGISLISGILATALFVIFSIQVTKIGADILPFVSQINLQMNPVIIATVMMLLVTMMGGLASAFGLKMVVQK